MNLWKLDYLSWLYKYDKIEQYYKYNFFSQPLSCKAFIDFDLDPPLISLYYPPLTACHLSKCEIFFVSKFIK